MALELNSNTYVLLEDADAYFDTRLNSEAWTGASEEDREKALLMAARTMNEFRYVGRKLASNQELAFPRVGINVELNEAQLIMYTRSIVIPNDVKYAQCEQAIYLLEGEDQNRQLMQSGVTSYGAGGANFSLYNDGYMELAPKAKHFLKPYLTRMGVIR